MYYLFVLLLCWQTLESFARAQLLKQRTKKIPNMKEQLVCLLGSRPHRYPVYFPLEILFNLFRKCKLFKASQKLCLPICAKLYASSMFITHQPKYPFHCTQYSGYRQHTQFKCGRSMPAYQAQYTRRLTYVQIDL